MSNRRQVSEDKEERKTIKMVKVCVVGASGGIGQPLSLLLKLNPYVSELALYDVRLAPGVAQDLSHINTNSNVTGYSKDDIEGALKGSQVVVIPAGVPRKPGMSRDDLFKINAGIIKGIVTSIGEYAPNSRILIISNPVNSTVPIAVEQLKAMGKLQPGNVMGVTTLDIVRAETFLVDYLANVKKSPTRQYDKTAISKEVTVIGGHSGKTIVPVVRNELYIDSLQDQYAEFIHRVQFGGDEVVKAKDGAGSATLSMALAGYRFTETILRSIHREATTPIPTFVYLPGISNGRQIQKKLRNEALEYFSLPVRLVDGRVSAIDASVLDHLSAKEQEMVHTAIQELLGSIDKGKKFVIGSSKL